MGSMTGRAAGYCAGVKMPGYTHPVPGRGFKMGAGKGPGTWRSRLGAFGRGWRHIFFATGLPGWNRFGERATPYENPALYRHSDPELVKHALMRQAEFLKSELDYLNKRITEIESDSA